MTRVRFLIWSATAFFLMAPVSASAALLPTCANQPGGCVELDQLLQLIVNYGRFILGLSGSVALAFFVWGGILMLTSAGKSEQVKQGKQRIVAATVGLVIIFSAFTVVKFGLRFLDPSGDYDQYILKKAPPPARK